MKQLRLLILPILLFTLCNSNAYSQTKDALPRSTPEAEGVSSAGILNFVEAAGKSKTEFHSFMFLRHGKVVAEGWWNPYRPELKHTMYSTSKSFTATAVGFAINEKKLNLTDKVVSFFPQELPDTVTSFLSELTVKDALSMSDGMDPDPTPIVARDTNWVKTFLRTPILNKPGTKFLYNSLGTYMLSAIVQKVTGQKEIDYLRPRLFEPLGIQGMDWETDLRGINTGGWGLRIKTEDMAKFGQLFLQKGNWKGKQLIPKAWVDEASAMKIIQHPELPQSKRDSSDWEQGYCYQMWRCRHNGYRADGAFGQFIIVLPDEDAVIAITAETADMQQEINLVWNYLLPAMNKTALPADKSKAALLKQKLAALALPLPAKNATASAEKNVSGKTFTIEQNDNHVENMSFAFSNNTCNLEIKTSKAAYKLAFESNKWHTGETNKEGPNLLAKAKESFAPLYPFKIAGSYTWKDEHTLQLVLRYIESPHTETMTCHFDEKNITVDIENSNDYGTKKTVLKGTIWKE